MTAQEAFAPILDSDEKIVESFKPNKFRFIGLGIIGTILKSLPVIIFGVIWALISGLFSDGAGSCTINRVEKTAEECAEELTWLPFIGYGLIAFMVLIIIIDIIFKVIKYSKVYFCYTNKRIIIRTGIIGADFQTLDFDMIGAMNVRVDFLDKLIHPNTGTLIFASAASPMIVNGTPGGVSGYMFVSIENPYEVYKRVKEYSSKNRDGKLNS